MIYKSLVFFFNMHACNFKSHIDLGPLIALKGFDSSLIRWCCMHVTNLGLLYGSNASVLWLVIAKNTSTKQLLAKKSPRFILGMNPGVWYCIIWICHSPQAVLTTKLLPRMMLCEDKYFDGDTFADQLRTAYADFKQFCRTKKIPSSQKMFTPRLVTQLNWYSKVWTK